MTSRAEEDPRRRPGSAEAPTTYNLLFVCTGNTCRSPMAAGIARAAVAERGWSHVAVRSAGVAAGAGAPAADAAVLVGAEHGVDLGDHRSQPLTPELVEWADAIVGMSDWHVARVAALGGAGRASLATEFLEGDDAGTEVPDPVGMDTDTYRATWDVLMRVVDGVLDRLEAILAP